MIDSRIIMLVQQYALFWYPPFSSLGIETKKWESILLPTTLGIIPIAHTAQITMMKVRVNGDLHHILWIPDKLTVFAVLFDSKPV